MRRLGFDYIVGQESTKVGISSRRGVTAIADQRVGSTRVSRDPAAVTPPDKARDRNLVILLRLLPSFAYWGAAMVNPPGNTPADARKSLGSRCPRVGSINAKMRKFTIPRFLHSHSTRTYRRRSTADTLCGSAPAPGKQSIGRPLTICIYPTTPVCSRSALSKCISLWVSSSTFAVPISFRQRRSNRWFSTV